ncbi:MAG: FAD-dependent oxidoreductase [Syntrophales bacterium]|jgi:NADPH-dependent glutamate synthase beta subunit-like oxidoreductase
MNEAENPNPLFMPLTYLTTESNKTGSWRFLRPRYDEKTSPCSATCPAGEDIARIEMLATQGLFKEAWETILWENPFPSVCGRVCFHPCEGQCNRREFDTAVAIHSLERFLADTAIRYGIKPDMKKMSSQKQKVAVIGAGPAGLSAAWFLSMLGYTCHVFEASEEAGGVLRWGIPLYRLPLNSLRHDIQQIEALGVTIYTGKPVSPDVLEIMKKDYDAVFIACGHGRGMSMNVPGEDLKDVSEGLDFLRKLREGKTPPCPGVSAIIGGGNTAIDVARSVVRLGGKALLLYRRRRQDMPALEVEVEMALEEGVQLQELVAPAAVAREGDQIVLTLQEMKIAGEEGGRARVVPDEGKTRKARIDRIFKAIGAQADEPLYQPPAGASGLLSLSHTVLVRGNHGPVMVFGGDLTNETKSVVHAVASGKQAAMALDTLFQEGLEAIVPKLEACRVGEGSSLSMEIYMGAERRLRNPHVVRYEEINTDYFRFIPRVIQPRLLTEERVQSFEEIDLKISANLAMRESERCFNCGLCNQCDNCFIFCPDISVIRDKDHQARHINYDYCKGCGLCVVECPRNAMSLGEEKS